MRFQLDENMPGVLLADLAALGHDAETCEQEGIAGTGDPAISAQATAEGRVVLSFDLDFANIVVFPPGTHSGHVVLRLHRPDVPSARAAVARLIRYVSESEMHGSIVIVDDTRIRIRPPTP